MYLAVQIGCGLDVEEDRWMRRAFGPVSVLCAVTLSVLVSGCGELTIGPSARVECDGPGSCPSGFRCSVALGQCVDSSIEATTPELVNVDWEQVTVGLNGEVRVSFEVEGDLAREPTVAFTAFDDGVFVRDSEAAGYSFVYRVRGNETEGPATAVIRLIGIDGEASDSAGRIITFDFTAPVVSSYLTPSGRYLRDGAQAQIQVLASEALSGEPAVTLNGVPMQRASAGSIDYLFTLTVGEDAFEVGPGSVTIDLIDSAGNPGSFVATEAFEFDFTAPELVNASDFAGQLRPGNVLAIDLLFNEALVQPPTVELVDADLSRIPLQLLDSSALGFTFIYNAEATEQGSFAVEVSNAVDLAGNASLVDDQARELGRVVIENTLPTLTASTLSQTRAKPGDVVSLDLTVSEPLSFLRASFSGWPLDLCEVDGANDTLYRCSHVVDVEEGEGPRQLEIEMLDLAGNRNNVVEPSLTYDSSPPIISNIVTMGSSALRLGSTGTLNFQINEALSALPTVLLDDGTTLDWVAGDAPGTLTYGFTASSMQSAGSKSLTVSAIDPAGNTSSSTQSDLFVLDFTVPTVASIDRLTEAVRIDGVVEVSVSFSELLGAPPTVVLRPKTGGATQSLQLLSDFGDRFTFILAASPSIEGEYTVQLENFTDIAGNDGLMTPIDLGDTVIDGQAPALVSSTSYTLFARAGDSIVVDFVLDSTPAETPDVRVSGLVFSDGCVTTGTNAYRCTHSVSAIHEPEGFRSFTAEVRDAAGNRGFLNLGGVTYDFTGPSVVAATALRSPALSTASTATELWLTDSDPLSGAPVSLTVTLVADETPSNVTVTLEDATESVALGLVSQDDRIVEYAIEVSSIPQDGSYQISATWDDAAGNTVTRTVAEPLVRVDRVAPLATLIDQENTLYKRLPWGNAANGYETSFSVSGAVTGSEAEQVFAYREATATASNFIGSTSVVSGAFEIDPLAGGDLSVVYLSVLDAAGNLSTPVKARYVQWVASLGGKIAGSALENPNRIETRPYFAGTLSQSDAAESGESGPSATGSAVRWRPLENPSVQLFNSNLAYDPTLGRAVITTDATGGILTQQLRGGVFSTLPVADPEGDGSPDCPEENQNALVYDAANDYVLMHCVDGTWSFNGTSWRLRAPAGAGPGGIAATLVYDVTRGKVVALSASASNDARRSNLDSSIWLWEGDGWTEVPAVGIEGVDYPGLRYRTRAVYDPFREAIVLFDGFVRRQGACPADTTNAFFCRFTDTWELSLNGWAKVALTDLNGDGGPVDSAFGTSLSAYVYLDADRAWSDPGVILSYNDDGETWTYDDREWERLIVTDPEGDGNPEPDGNATIFYDPLERVIYLLDFEFDASLWRFTGSSWLRVTGDSADTPDSRYGSAIAYDSARGVTVMFGGRLNDGDSCDGGVDDDCAVGWEFDGVTWTRIAAAGPEGRRVHRMAYHPASGGVMFFGGHNFSGDCAGSGQDECGDTWIWTGSSWDQRCDGDDACTNAPSARSYYAMTYDPGSGHVWLFGGSGNGTLAAQNMWRWDGTDWSTPFSSTPARNFGNDSRLTPIGHSGVLLLVGQDYDNGDPLTYEFDTTTGVFTELSTMASGHQSGSAMFYDPDRDLVFLHEEGLSAWDGSAWTEQAYGNPLLAEVFPDEFWHDATYDSGLGRPLLYASFADAGFFELDTAAARAPAHTFTAALSEANLDPKWGLDRVDLSWQGGGTGYRNGGTCSSEDGAQLLVWLGTDWAPVATTAGPASSASAISWSTAAASPWSTKDARELRATLARRDITFAITPLAPNGCSAAGASVATGLAELDVRYQTCFPSGESSAVASECCSGAATLEVCD